MTEYPLPANADPHTVSIDRAGGVWYTGNHNRTVGRLDPATGEITEFKMPDPAARDPHTAVFDDNGTMWFTLQQSNMVGRLDSATGAIKEWPSPSGPKSHPYGLAVVDGIVWYNESGTRPDALVRFDPRSETFQSWPIPAGGVYAGIVRHMRPTRDGNLLIHQSSTNRIILVTIDNAAVTQ